MSHLYVTLKIHRVIENQPLIPAHRVIANYLLLCYYDPQVTIPNAVHHVRNRNETCDSVVDLKAARPQHKLHTEFSSR